jgi:dihydroflavonol-4-reductase
VRAFVTGATGFLGRRLVHALVDRGSEAVALLHRSTGEGLPPGVRHVRGDVLQPTSLADAGAGCDVVVHLAASISFDPRRRQHLVLVNAQGTANVLALARRWSAGRTIVVSSACTLGISGRPDQVLDEESRPDRSLAERNPYMASKLAAEDAARAAASEQDVVVVNPTTVYGPGDDSLNSGTLVLRVARSRLLPVPPGGTNVVDVDDVVDGILAAAERGRSGRRYVLGGENLPFAEVFGAIAAAVGRRPSLVPVPRPAEPLFSLAALVSGSLTGSRFLTPQIVEDLFRFKYYSSARARDELGWSPQFRFPQSVSRAWTYYRARGLA